MSGSAPPRADADEESDDYELEESDDVKEEEEGPAAGKRVKDQPTMLDLMTGKYNMEEDDDDESFDEEEDDVLQFTFFF